MPASSPEKAREQQARYRRTAKGCATAARYAGSLKGKIANNTSKARRRLEVDNG